MRLFKSGLPLLFLLAGISSFSQSAVGAPPSESGITPAAGYLFPIAPGVPNTLAGTMGELRNTHFHSGLDIRTNNQIGAAVLSAQDGYISRAVKSSQGYGNVLYVTHPNGHTTLYAHLDRFKGAHANHILAEQYRMQAFEVDLRFPEDKFRVKRGDTIALSGNTGSSSGPHLHFDLRDEKMDAINPLHYGFREITDQIPPIVQVIALRTMDKHSRINGKFGRFEFRAYRTGGKYRIATTVEVRGKIGIEILGYDRMDNSGFQCGINEYTVTANGRQVFNQVINRIDMENTRGILSVMDYQVLETRGHRYNKLYVEDGNPMDFYSGVVDQGFIRVSEKPVSLELTMKDSYGNTSVAELLLKPGTAAESVPSLDAVKALPGFEKWGHYLVARLPYSKEASVFRKGTSSSVSPDYHSRLWSVFILDMRNGIPDSLSNGRTTLRFGINDRIPSHTDFTWYSQSFSVHFRDSSLFDTLYFSASHRMEGTRETLVIGDKTTPLLRPITIELRPIGPASQGYSAYRVDDGRYIFLPGSWSNGKIRFSSSHLGKFVLLPDAIPPNIRRIQLTANSARFRIGDNLSGIQSFEARVNGEWLLMNYEHKTGILFSERPTGGMVIKGEFQLKVTDRNGNTRIFKQKVI